MLNVNWSAVLRQYYGETFITKCGPLLTARYTYELSIFNKSVSTYPSKFVTKPFNEHLEKMSVYLTDFINQIPKGYGLNLCLVSPPFALKTPRATCTWPIRLNSATPGPPRHALRTSQRLPSGMGETISCVTFVLSKMRDPRLRGVNAQLLLTLLLLHCGTTPGAALRKPLGLPGMR